MIQPIEHPAKIVHGKNTTIDLIIVPLGSQRSLTSVHFESSRRRRGGPEDAPPIKRMEKVSSTIINLLSLQRFSQFFIPRSFMYVRDDFNSSFRRWIFKIFSYLQFVETRAGSKSVYYYRCICPIFRVSCKYRKSGMPVNGFYTVSLTISSFILDDINVCSFGLRYKHKISLS